MGRKSKRVLVLSQVLDYFGVAFEGLDVYVDVGVVYFFVDLHLLLVDGQGGVVLIAQVGFEVEELLAIAEGGSEVGVATFREGGFFFPGAIGGSYFLQVLYNFYFAPADFGSS